MKNKNSNFEKTGKIAFIKSGFFENYIDKLIDFAHSNNIKLDLFSVEEFKANKNINPEQYDYVIGDCLSNPDIVNVSIFHGHTIKQRLKSISNKIYSFIFYIGHRKKIKQSEKQYRSLKKIIGVGNCMKNDFVNNYKIDSNNIIVVHAGFHKPDFISENALKDKTKKFILSMSGIGFVKKGGYRMLNALRIFHKKYPDINIEANIIYDNYKKNFMISLYTRLFNLRDIVKFKGYQSDFYAFCQNSHCFVCPSLLEPFGRVVTEAMYAKVPVIVGSNIGAADIINDGKNGFVFDADKNADENLALKIKEVYDKYETLDKVVENAYQTTLKLTWDDFARNLLLGLYPELKDKQ